jgi:hypothetical protein
MLPFVLVLIGISLAIFSGIQMNVREIFVKSNTLSKIYVHLFFYQ